MGTGETVAVKQVKLADLPKSELRVITVSIRETVTNCLLILTVYLFSLRSIF